MPVTGPWTLHPNLVSPWPSVCYEGSIHFDVALWCPCKCIVFQQASELAGMGTTSLKPGTYPFTLAPLSLGSSGQQSMLPSKWTIWVTPQKILAATFSPDFITRDPQFTCFLAPKQKHVQQNWCWKGAETQQFKSSPSGRQFSQRGKYYLNQPGYFLLDL